MRRCLTDFFLLQWQRPPSLMLFKHDFKNRGGCCIKRKLCNRQMPLTALLPLLSTRTFLWVIFCLAWKSACMNVGRERQEMSKNELQSSGEPRSGGFANGAEWTVTLCWLFAHLKVQCSLKRFFLHTSISFYPWEITLTLLPECTLWTLLIWDGSELQRCIGAVAEMFHSLKASQFLGGDLRSILQ